MSDPIPSAAADLSRLRIDRDRPPSGKGRAVLVLTVLLAAGGGVAAWRLAPSTRLPEIEVGIVRLAGSGEGTAVLSAGGYILPDRKANVSSKGFGRLEWIGVDVGSRVRAGEVIARLAHADLAARLDEAKASLADAEREFARWQRVVQGGVEPRERLDRAETQLHLARARVATAEAEMEYTLIRAPFDGLVVRKSAEIGETVGPLGGPGSASAQGSLCTVVDPASLEMVADVNEIHIGKIRTGQAVEVTAEALPDRRFRGEVRQIVPTADRQKGIVQVKVRLLDADPALLPEMSARAAFLREGEASSGVARRVMAPAAAVRERGGRRFVLVFEGGKVREIPVETGAAGEDGVEVTEGLLGGEQVVVGGAPVADGTAVRLKDKEKR